MSNIAGRMPDVLAKLTEIEIEEAGANGYDATTFLQSKGLTDPLMLQKAIKFQKWYDNYDKGYAQYKLKLSDALYKATITNGDVQALKELARSILGIKPEEGDNKMKVTVIGADGLKPKMKSGTRGQREPKVEKPEVLKEVKKKSKIQLDIN